MKIDNNLTNRAVLLELGRRLKKQRIDSGLSQAELAVESGISKRTVERIESGGSVQICNMIRVLRVLNLLNSLNLAIPEIEISPIDLLNLKGKARERVSRRAKSGKSGRQWQWGEKE
jgi:transcriptional regulator with XRE-family HTH domain